MGGRDIRAHVIWASVLIIMCLIGVTAYVSTTDMGTTRYLSLFGTVVAPVLGIIVVMFQNAAVKDKAALVEQKVDKIEAQTNGNLHEKLDEVKTEVINAVETVVHNGQSKEGE